GSFAFAIGHGAGHGIDHDIFRSGIIFGGVGVGDAEDVAGEFDEGVLKASAGAEKGPVAAAGELDALEHAVEAFVGAAGRGPEAVERFEDCFRVGSSQGWGGDPFGVDGVAQFVGGVLERIGGGVVGTECRIEVTKDSDADSVTHVVIVLEGAEAIGWGRLGGWCWAEGENDWDDQADCGLSICDRGKWWIGSAPSSAIAGRSRLERGRWNQPYPRVFR